MRDGRQTDEKNRGRRAIERDNVSTGDVVDELAWILVARERSAPLIDGAAQIAGKSIGQLTTHGAFFPRGPAPIQPRAAASGARERRTGSAARNQPCNWWFSPETPRKATWSL
jgi:hypothetical protein